jgi:hypothetical protein
VAQGISVGSWNTTPRSPRPCSPSQSTAAGGIHQVRDDPERGGLPAARRAEERDEIALVDLQRHVLQRDDIAAEDLVDVIETQKRRALVQRKDGVVLDDHGSEP